MTATSAPTTTDLAATPQEILDRLESAWNAADGAAYGAPFTADADFVAIRGDYSRGREAIADGHEGILHSIYAGSTARFHLRSDGDHRTSRSSGPSRRNVLSLADLNTRTAKNARRSATRQNMP